MHRDKLIKHLYRCFVNEFGVLRENTAIITKKMYFPKGVGFSDWINRLHAAGVLNRVRNRRCSKYELGDKGIKYLQMMYQESVALEKEASYIADETADMSGTQEVTVEGLQKEIITMNEKLELIISMLTPEQIKEIPERHLKLVKDE